MKRLFGNRRVSHWLSYALSGGLILLLGILVGKGCDARATEEWETICQMELVLANTNVEQLEWINEKLEGRNEGKLGECRTTLEDREWFWKTMLDEVREEKSGEWCWERKKDLEYDLEAEKRMSLWRLKSAGYIASRTGSAVRRCDQCIKRAGISKPDIPGERPVDWEDDLDWAKQIVDFTEAEIEKMGD